MCISNLWQEGGTKQKQPSHSPTCNICNLQSWEGLILPSLIFSLPFFFFLIIFCQIAMWTCLCSQLEACNSSEVASKQKRTKRGPGDGHLWLLAAMVPCSCLSPKDVQQVPPPGSTASRTASCLLQVLIVPRGFRFNYLLAARKMYSCDQGYWNQHPQSASFLAYGDSRRLIGRHSGRICNEVCWQENSKRVRW